jgi:hypothetical protein
LNNQPWQWDSPAGRRIKDMIKKFLSPISSSKPSAAGIALIGIAILLVNVEAAGTAVGKRLSVSSTIGRSASLDLGPDGAGNVNVHSANLLRYVPFVNLENGIDSAILSSAESNLTGLGVRGRSVTDAPTNIFGIVLVPGVLVTPDFLKLSSGQFGALSSKKSAIFAELGIADIGVNQTLDSNSAPNPVVDLVASGITDSDILANLTNAQINSPGALDSGLPNDLVESQFNVSQSSSSSSTVFDLIFLATIVLFPAIILSTI